MTVTRDATFLPSQPKTVRAGVNDAESLRSCLWTKALAISLETPFRRLFRLAPRHKLYVKRFRIRYNGGI